MTSATQPALGAERTVDETLLPVLRRTLAFDCEGAQCLATLDLPPGEGAVRTGLLIITGGNEIRAGAWNGQALVARALAEAGHAVFRFDRRGVGDSEGANGGFRTAAPDIAAALAAFRKAVPGLARVVAWGNCDAASALMLAKGRGCDGLVLSNPWTYEDADEPETAEEPAPRKLTPAELRAHYRARLLSPAALRRLVTGGVPVGKLVRSVLGMFRKAPPPSTLAQDIARGLAAFNGPARLLVAGRDRTGQAFLATWDRADPRLAICAPASHSFVEPEAFTWLQAELLAALAS